MAGLNRGALRAALLAALGMIGFAAAPPAMAADLDDDGPRYRTGRDYWGDREYEPRYTERSCASRHVIRDRLRNAGWRDFENAVPRGDVVMVEARRRSGRPFRLRIDRCSGDIVDATPLAPPPRAYRNWREDRDDWRWRRPGWRRWADGPRRNWDRRDYY